MAVPTPESCLPLIPLPDSHLVISISQVNFGEDLGGEGSVEHVRYEGKEKAIFDGNSVQSPVVDNEAQLPIRTLDKHHGIGSNRLGGPDEVVSEVMLDVAIYFGEFWCKHPVDCPSRRGCVGLQGYLDVILSVKMERVAWALENTSR